MHPEPLHGGGLLHGVGGGQQHAHDDAGEVAQVEQVVGLGGGGQQVHHRLLVHLQRAVHDLVDARLELVAETPASTTDRSYRMLFLVPASAPRLVYQRPWYVLSCLWDGAYKRTLAVNRKE